VTYLLGGSTAALAIAVVVLAWRAISAANGAASAREDTVVERIARGKAELDLESERIGHAQTADGARRTAKELAETTERYEARLAELRADISKLEGDLEACTTPGSRAAVLGRMLERAAPGGAGADRG